MKIVSTELGIKLDTSHKQIDSYKLHISKWTDSAETEEQQD